MNIQNKRAYFDYQIIEELTGGLILQGSEVKSLRAGNANITEAYIYEKGGELWITNMYIAKYTQAFYTNHEELRERKLLLNKKEILHLKKEVETAGLTIVPIKIILLKNKFKLVFGLAKGKKNWDKRESIRSKDIERDMRRNEN
jgi:SsrA-binding protein